MEPPLVRRPAPLDPRPTKRDPRGRVGRPPGRDRRLKLVAFRNRSGTEAWRIVGKVDGVRVRRNFPTREEAESWRHEAEHERLLGPAVETLRSTWLTEDQLRIAEGLFHQASGDELGEALRWWLRHGKEQVSATTAGAGIALFEAFTKFKQWLAESRLRPRSRKNLTDRVHRFVLGLGHAQLGDITADSVDAWISARPVSAATRDNDRRAISRLFSWCMERPRRWIRLNPCSSVRVERPKRGTPPTLAPEGCLALMRAAESHQRGRQVRYLALCLFGGIRPEEAARLRDTDLNLADGEVRIRAEVSKTHVARTVAVGDTPLGAWLLAYPAAPLRMSATTRRRDLLAIRQAAGIEEWPNDVLRHTAASALIRICGSYATVADRLGNSETILRKHYVAGWPTAMADAWAAILPTPANAKAAPASKT